MNKIKTASRCKIWPDDGLFKLKHIAYFTLYSGLCMTTWKRNISAWITQWRWLTLNSVAAFSVKTVQW